MSTRTLSATAVVVAILALIVARLDLPVGEPSSAIAAPSAPPDPPAIFAVGAQVQYSHEFPEKGNVWDTDSENPQNLIVGASIEIPDFHDVNSHWSVDLAPDHIRITYTAAMQGAALGAFNGHHIKDSLGTLPPFPKLKLGAETTLKAVEVTQGPDNIYINLAGVDTAGLPKGQIIELVIDAPAPPPCVPVGAIIAWHKSLAGTPPLSTEWMECNGQPVNDPNSPYDKKTLPDLNGEVQVPEDLGALDVTWIIKIK